MSDWGVSVGCQPDTAGARSPARRPPNEASAPRDTASAHGESRTSRRPNQPEWPVLAGAVGSGIRAYVESEPASPNAQAAASRSNDPLGRLLPGLSRGTRVALDWIFTIAGAVLIVLAVKQWVVNPYRIPSSSMEPYSQL